MEGEHNRRMSCASPERLAVSPDELDICLLYTVAY